MQRIPLLSKGSIIWTYDAHYQNGRPHTTYAECWRPRKITGERRAHWLVDGGWPIHKKGGPGICFTRQDMLDDVWAYENRNGMMLHLARLPPQILRQAAQAMNYKQPRVVRAHGSKEAKVIPMMTVARSVEQAPSEGPMVA